MTVPADIENIANFIEDGLTARRMLRAQGMELFIAPDGRTGARRMDGRQIQPGHRRVVNELWGPLLLAEAGAHRAAEAIRAAQASARCATAKPKRGPGSRRRKQPALTAGGQDDEVS